MQTSSISECDNIHESIIRFEPCHLFALNQCGLNERYAMLNGKYGLDVDLRLGPSKYLSPAVGENMNCNYSESNAGSDHSCFGFINKDTEILDKYNIIDQYTENTLSDNSNNNRSVSSNSNYSPNAIFDKSDNSNKLIQKMYSLINLKRTFSDPSAIASKSAWKNSKARVDRESEKIDDILDEIWPLQKSQKGSKDHNMGISRSDTLVSCDKCAGSKGLCLGTNSKINAEICENGSKEELLYSDILQEMQPKLDIHASNMYQSVEIYSMMARKNKCRGGLEKFSIKEDRLKSSGILGEINTPNKSQPFTLDKRERIKLVAGLAAQATARKQLYKQSLLNVPPKICGNSELLSV
ncbi:hypothetical protein BB561_004215 [Smittium simulii]|uniref:Uncharacterized protein n=1 Tax=Smittium simulii TaxID=133385 RepID=A0A2T9YHE4_9FUNG|nr:hypothetical protein BB561_004215 [Smittium simulii]